MSDPKLPIGTNYCKCSACGEYFGGVTAFDLHRYGNYPERACLPPADVKDKHERPLLKVSKRGYWVREY